MGSCRSHGCVLMHSFWEFFAGAGMARLGLGAGWECTFANDFSASKAASYTENFGADHLNRSDVASLTRADLPAVAPDLVWASPPCQDVSEAGPRVGLDGPRSGAFWPWWGLM
jgi:DNA (cytosine-5)-methyltransferase 1